MFSFFHTFLIWEFCCFKQKFFCFPTNLKKNALPKLSKVHEFGFFILRHNHRYEHRLNSEKHFMHQSSWELQLWQKLSSWEVRLMLWWMIIDEFYLQKLNEGVILWWRHKIGTLVLFSSTNNIIISNNDSCSSDTNCLLKWLETSFLVLFKS